jgi:hypothetical protein
MAFAPVLALGFDDFQRLGSVCLNDSQFQGSRFGAVGALRD